MVNKKRFIDANGAIEKLKAAKHGAPVVRGLTPFNISMIIKFLEKCDTVKSVPVVHGRWELHGNDDDCGCSYFCSNCHESYDEDWFYIYGKFVEWNYCPNCGALMKDGDGNG